LIVAGPDAPLILVLLKVTALPGQIAVSFAVKLTVGLAYTVIVRVLLLDSAPLVTVSVTTWTPAVRKLDDAVYPETGDPVPKFQE
jgi:hypothetical protein